MLKKDELKKISHEFARQYDIKLNLLEKEDDLFNLELEAFMKLIETKKTQDRIKHTLSTGKPLVN